MIWETIKAELSGSHSRGFALAKHFLYEDISREDANGCVTYTFNGDLCVSDTDDYDSYDNYYVCTDEEADDLASGYIKDSLWAFNSDFLAYETGLPEAVFIPLSERFDTDAIYEIVYTTCGIDAFVEAAIAADGRGHFIAQYDHEEHEQVVGDNTYYIYRWG